MLENKNRWKGILLVNVATLAWATKILSVQFLQQIHLNLGDVWILLAVLVWALYSVAGRKFMKSPSALSATAISMWMGLPLLLGAAVFELYLFSVRDDGIGLPECFDSGFEGGFGFTLVGLLSEQLNGSLQIAGTRGTEVTIDFSV